MPHCVPPLPLAVEGWGGGHQYMPQPAHEDVCSCDDLDFPGSPLMENALLANNKMDRLAEKLRSGLPACANRRQALPFVLAIAIALLNMAVVWNDARHNAYVPCVENCGESFRVFKYVQDYRTYGAKYGFIEDYADERNPNRVPLLYTHNMSMPGILFAALEAAGIHELSAKQFVILLVHGLGLFYAFLAVRYLTGSSGLGIVFLGLLATDYELVFGFALSPLRSWHWLALFGLLYHVGHVVRATSFGWHLVACSIFAAMAFGVGYDYFTICLVICGFCAALYIRPGLKPSEVVVMLLGLGVAFFVPVALRQAQIAVVLGWNYWSTDFYYTLMTKAAFLQDVFPLPPAAQIDEFYRAHGVFRPSTAASSAVAGFAQIRDLIRYVLVPLFGSLTLLLFIVVTTLASATVAWRGLVRSGTPPLGWTAPSRRSQMLRLTIVLALGTVCGLAIFPDHNILIFVKHKVPLIAAPVMFAKAVAIVGFVTLGWWALARKSMMTGCLSIGLAVLIVIDHAVIEFDNIRAKTPYHFTWIDEVRKNPDASYAVSWDPTAVSVFTDTKVTSLSTRDELWLLDYVGQRSGQPAQYPTISRPATLTTIPDYWLYFPTDAMSPFDSFDPMCRLDYLSRFALRLVYHGTPTIVAGSNWVRPSPARPGGFVMFGGRLDDLPFRDSYKLQVHTRENLDGEVVTNCHYQTFLGWVRTRAGQAEGSYSVAIAAQDPGLPNLKTQIAYQLSKDAPPSDFEHPALTLQLPMPTADALSQRYLSLPVAKRGAGWIMFDLRGLK
jgi:hypothetical protein